MGQDSRHPCDSPVNGSPVSPSLARLQTRTTRSSTTGASPSAHHLCSSSLEAALNTPSLAADHVGVQLKQRRHTRIALKAHRTRTTLRKLVLWLLVSIVGGSAITVSALIALAPRLADRGEAWQGPARPSQGAAVAEPLRVALDGEHFYQLDLDPRLVEFGLLRGWDREQEAFADPDALAFFSGPMYERYHWPDPRLEQVIDQTVQPSSPQRAADQGYTVPLGDLKFGPEIWRGLNRAAAGQRAFIGIDYAGEAIFGYGELTAERARAFETFIGGLHVLYNDLQPVQPGYQGAYSKGLGQKIRYYLPRVRVVIGLRPDRRLEVLMSKDGLTMEETRELSRQQGLVAAYIPDHASKSRFIVPGVKGFSEEDANWISGGSTSYVHVPYMIRISRRQQPAVLQPGPIITPPHAPQQPVCAGLLSCVKDGALWAGDRSLSGLNRLMGVVLGGKSLPEPPITADPPAPRFRFPSTPPLASLPQDDPNPIPQPWESAWMPGPQRIPAEGVGAAPEGWHDMAEPIVVPRNASEDFWEQAFPLPPSLPALDPDQGIRPAAPPESKTALRQQPRPLPLPALTPNPASPGSRQPPEFPSTQPATQEESTSKPQVPSPPALDPGLGWAPALPRLDLGNLP